MFITIRILDIVLSLVGLILLSPILILVCIIGFMETGSPLFFQKRLGLHKKPFLLIKFRTMSVGTKSVPTHLAKSSSVTKIGSILRKTKLDELPQLFNVFLGDMSIVGPRPNLLSQSELISMRDSKGVYNVKPGITGLSQIKNIDMSTPGLLAETDSKMIENYSLIIYCKIIIKTAVGKGSGDAIIR